MCQDKTFQDFQYFGTRPGQRLLERKTNRQVRDRDLSIFKIGATPRQTESIVAFSLETKRRPRVSSFTALYIVLSIFENIVKSLRFLFHFVYRSIALKHGNIGNRTQKAITEMRYALRLCVRNNIFKS